MAGTVPAHDDVLLSTERLTVINEIDIAERRVRVGAGVTLTELQRAAAAAGLLVGVDLAARDSATVGGMVSTNAGGLHTVRYGASDIQYGIDEIRAWRAQQHAFERTLERLAYAVRVLGGHAFGAEQCIPVVRVHAFNADLFEGLHVRQQRVALFSSHRDRF